MARNMSNNPQHTSTGNNNGDSPVGRVMDEAIDLDIEGRSPYPKGATFIDADVPYLGKAIRRAVNEDSAIVLVAADGSTCILRAEPAQNQRQPRLSLRVRGVLKTLTARPRAVPR
jgi:hypothetical protein